MCSRSIVCLVRYGSGALDVRVARPRATTRSRRRRAGDIRCRWSTSSGRWSWSRCIHCAAGLRRSSSGGTMRGSATSSAGKPDHSPSVTSGCVLPPSPYIRACVRTRARSLQASNQPRPAARGAPRLWPYAHLSRYRARGRRGGILRRAPSLRGDRRRRGGRGRLDRRGRGRARLHGGDGERLRRSAHQRVRFRQDCRPAHGPPAMAARR